MKRFITSIVLAIVANHAAAQTDTTFTYQGTLSELGGPVSGSFDMDFSLWDALSQGRKVVPSVILNGVAVNDGLFTVELDFGATAFDNSSRWLEIGVNGNTLSPRQSMTRSPYSIQTRGIFVDENNDVGIGTTDPAATLHVEGPILSGGPNGGDITARNPNNAIAGVGLGWHNDVPRIRIGGEGVGTFDGFDIQTVGNRSLLRILNDGNVAIAASPDLSASLKVGTTIGSTAIRGECDKTEAVGVYGWASSASSTSFDSQGVHGISSSTRGQGVRGEAYALTGVNYGVYGSSSSLSGYDFYASSPWQKSS